MYVANNSRTQRPRVPKFGMNVLHLRCDSHTSFKVKWSKVRVTDGWGHTVSAKPSGHSACLHWYVGHAECQFTRLVVVISVMCVELWFIDASLTAAFPLPDPDLPRLTHPSKARPRNQKHHAAKCPVVASKFELIENFTGQDVGLDVFFGSVTSDTQQPRSTNQKPVASQRRFYSHLHSLLSTLCYMVSLIQ